MKLNLGSGSFYTEDWCNVDLYAENVDVRASAYHLPFKANTFSTVYMGHVLEHLPFDKIPKVLKEIQRVCVNNSEVIVVGPCMDKAIATEQPEWLLEAIRPTPQSVWGVQQGAPNVDPAAPGVEHEWTATTALTIEAMESVLFDVQEIDIATTLYPATPNRVIDPWQCAIRGYTRKGRRRG